MEWFGVKTRGKKNLNSYTLNILLWIYTEKSFQEFKFLSANYEKLTNPPLSGFQWVFRELIEWISFFSFSTLGTFGRIFLINQKKSFFSTRHRSKRFQSKLKTATSIKCLLLLFYLEKANKLCCKISKGLLSFTFFLLLFNIQKLILWRRKKEKVGSC